MQIEKFIDYLYHTIENPIFCGVPDSHLKPLCNYLMKNYGISSQHIIAANEGNCTAIAAGYHLATGRIPVVYMQNSGIGNVINPIASLLNDEVYAIPCIFIIGWRGEPGIHDEPQHIYQGKVTIKLLEDMDVKTFILGKETTDDELADNMQKVQKLLKKGKSIAFVIRKGVWSYAEKVEYKNDYLMYREEIIENIVQAAGEDIIVSTTGKASRELFEIREAKGQPHQADFLTVGSMGHSSSIALGIALNKIEQKIWCIDGDGAALMHLGAMAVIGSHQPNNLIHILINNEAHETVGGMPTVAKNIDFIQIALGCGYQKAVCVKEVSELVTVLRQAKNSNELTFIEVKAQIGARDDLGRPTIKAVDNKKNFMQYIKTLD